MIFWVITIPGVQQHKYEGICVLVSLDPKDQQPAPWSSTYWPPSTLTPTADIGKSTGPRSLTGENSGGPMKTIVVPVLLSGKKKNPVGGPSMGTLMLKEMSSCKSFGGPVKLGFSMWSPALQSGKDPKVFPMSATVRLLGLSNAPGYVTPKNRCYTYIKQDEMSSHTGISMV